MKQKFLLLLLTAYSTYTYTDINTGGSRYKKPKQTDVQRTKRADPLRRYKNTKNNFMAFVTSFNTLDAISQLRLLNSLLGSEMAGHIMYISIQNFNKKLAQENLIKQEEIWSKTHEMDGKLKPELK